MILFDLLCSRGHGFEAWFRDGGSFERLAAVGEVQCAICGDTDVRKALMAPSVRSSKAVDSSAGKEHAEEAAALQKTKEKTAGESGTAMATPQGSAPAVSAPATSSSDRASFDAGSALPHPEKLAEAMQVLRKVQTHIEKTFDHVGKQFAEEARKMHYGETEKRSIYGEATKEESEQLLDEGIEVDRMPWLPDRND